MYKQIIIIAGFIFLGWSLQAQSPASQPSTQPTSQPTIKTAKTPIMTFETRMLDLGDVKRGEVKKFEFKYVNTGTSPLKIDLISSCDCTTTEYAKKSILPGESSEIKVTFDSTEKEESETIDIDIFLQNEDPSTGAPIIEMLQYKYILIK